MQKFKSNITTTTGAAIRNVPVFVLTESGAIASIFLDRAGAVAAPNPLSTDSKGVFYFYAVNGRYSLRTTVEGVTVTDDDVVLMNDPEELATAGPIAEAVAAAQAAAQQAQDAVEESGIPDLVAAAQNAVVDANNAVEQAQAAASTAASAQTQAAAAKVAAEQAQTLANTAQGAAETAAAASAASSQLAAQSAASVDPAFLRNRANHTGAQAIGTVSGLQTALDEKASSISVAQAIAMAATFTAVPTTYQAFLIVVILPHVRLMQWNGTKYVRSPVGKMPCELLYTYDNPASLPYALPVRADVNWNQADFPDVVERLGLSGTGTFTLVEARGEGIRVLDNGRGIDTGRVLRSAQGDAGRNLTGGFTTHVPGNHSVYRTGAIQSGATTATSTTTSPANYSTAPGTQAEPDRFGYILNASLQWPTANEFRVRTIAFPLWMTF